MKTIKLLAAGVAGWIVGIAILFGLSWKMGNPETFSSALLWALEYWWIAFGLGLLVMLASAVVSKTSPVRALVAYIVPVALLAALGGLCLLIYPNAGFREELLGSLPVAVVFYVFGCIWAGMSKDSAGSSAKAMLPPLIGGFLILTLVALPVFTGNAFRYRNAFDLDVVKIDHPEGAMVVSCVLQISKAGDYAFTAPPSYMAEPMYYAGYGEKEIPPGKITWGAAGPPKAGDTGKYPLVIRWDDLPNLPAEFRKELMLYETQVLLEARRSSEPEKVLFTVAGDTEKAQVN